MMWKEAWWLAVRELKYQWKAILATLLFTVFIALLTSELFTYLIQSKDTYRLYLLDVIFLGLTPSLATLFISKPYLSFSTISDDPFTKRIAFFRLLPIPIEVLSRSRMIFTMLLLVMMSLFFYTVIFLTLPLQIPEPFFTSNEFLKFALFWFGYALALSGFMPFLEFGLNSRMFFILQFVIAAVLAIGLLSLYPMTEKGIIAWSFYLLKDWGWNAVILSWLIGTISVWGWKCALHHRFMYRDYV